MHVLMHVRVHVPQAGKVASREVSRAFPPPMELKFERVCLPLMLLHVNRWVPKNKGLITPLASLLLLWLFFTL